MIRRVSSALAVPVALVALLSAFILPASPAVPAVPAVPYGCSIAVPTVVWVTRPQTRIPASLGPDCAAHYATYASWNVRHSSLGTSDIFIFDQKRSAANSFYDWEPFGTYFVEPRNSWSNFFELSQNSRSYVVKAGSGISLSAARVGRYVTLNLRTSYYNPQIRSYRTWPRARVDLQFRTCPTCAWRHLQVARTGPAGTVAVRTYAAHTRYYRAVSAATPAIWGRTSAGVRR